jgi:predicted permease
MNNLVIVFACLFLGFILKKSQRFPSGSFRILNAFIIHISLPALVLLHIHNLKFENSVIYVILMPWIVFLIAMAIFWSMYKLRFLTRNTAGCLVLTCGLGNTSFVGLPLIEAYFGKEYLGVGILLDQFGTFLALGTVGIVFAFYAKSGVWNFKNMGKMIVFFPPSYALLIAVFLRSYEYPDWLNDSLLRLGDTLTPLALVSIGLQLNPSHIMENFSKIFIGLSYKLVLAPVIILILYFGILNLHDKNFQVVVFESGMGPMVTGTIVAIENDLDPDLAAVILGLGIILSLLSTYVLFSFVSNV